MVLRIRTKTEVVQFGQFQNRNNRNERRLKILIVDNSK